MPNKEDRRIKMTRRLLKDALIEMLKTKDIYHISIRDLCENADVNRTTFYKYYGSQFELLADMEKDILDYISNTVSVNESQPEKILTSVCRYINDNLEFLRLIINNNVDPNFAKNLFAMESIKENVIKKYPNIKTNEEQEYIYNFFTYGAFRMVCVWMNKENRESPEVFAKLVKQLILNS